MKNKIYLIALTALFSANLFASDLIEVLPITNQILRLTFDDGYFENKETSNAVAHKWVLDLNAAERIIYYQIKSEDDSEYKTALMPVKIGRKSKIHDITKNCYWNETLEKCINDYIQYHYIYVVLPKPMKDGKTYTVEVPVLADNIKSWQFTYDIKKLRSPSIHTNQMGFVPSSRVKYAYISQWMGDLGGLNLNQHSDKSFVVYKLDDKGKIEENVFTGTITKQKDYSIGKPDSEKEDVGPKRNFLKSDVWECDFSEITDEGEYILSVSGIGCSYPFRISEDVYFEPFYYSARANYLGRAIDELPEKFAGDYKRPKWEPNIVYTKFRTMDLNTESGNTQKQEIYDNIDYDFDLSDIRGWYHDAGDWDGYYSHFRVPRELMLVYEMAPEKFQDGELNIPESQIVNGYDTEMPDLLDESVWLVDYFKNNIGPTGGIFGSRVQPDISTSSDLSNAEEHKAKGFNFKKCLDEVDGYRSFLDCRTWIVHGEDPRDSYSYASIAAQYAYNLYLTEDQTGEDYSEIRKEYLESAASAYDWAETNASEDDWNSAGGSHNRGTMKSAKLAAATWLFKATGEERYHKYATENLSEYDEKNFEIDPDKYAVWAYASIDPQMDIYNGIVDLELRESLIKVTEKFADARVVDAIETYNRSMRMGGDMKKPILNGQATTPYILPAIIAYELTSKQKYLDACYTTCDYMLGGNQLNYLWLTEVGHQYPKWILHKDTEDDGIDGNIPGVPPYSPRVRGDWMRYKGDRYDYQGPWDNDFYLLDGRIYPDYQDADGETQWPVHELWFDAFPSPPSTEYTIHQNIAPAAAAYGYLTANDKISSPNQTPTVEFEVDSSSSSENEKLKFNYSANDVDGWIYSVKIYKDNHFIKELNDQEGSIELNSSDEFSSTYEIVVSDNLGKTVSKKLQK